MPHQCTRCGEIYKDVAPELLVGCRCGSKFFYYIKQEKFELIRKEVQETLFELERSDKDRIEEDIREITGFVDEPDKPVILDLESVRVISPGKFEIDIINLFNKRRPIIYKLEEGKYVIDLSSSIKVSKDEIDKKIKNPETSHNSSTN
ncbi:MAG: Zn-ribbon containing protein [Nanoarchaeota archaeon]|nr:Zn-ribbon containing protein [Nanoarchaeota archaeon]